MKKIIVLSFVFLIIFSSMSFANDFDTYTKLYNEKIDPFVQEDYKGYISEYYGDDLEFEDREMDIYIEGDRVKILEYEMLKYPIGLVDYHKRFKEYFENNENPTNDDILQLEYAIEDLKTSVDLNNFYIDGIPKLGESLISEYTDIINSSYDLSLNYFYRMKFPSALLFDNRYNYVLPDITLAINEFENYRKDGLEFVESLENINYAEQFKINQQEFYKGLVDTQKELSTYMFNSNFDYDVNELVKQISEDDLFEAFLLEYKRQTKSIYSVSEFKFIENLIEDINSRGLGVTAIDPTRIVSKRRTFKFDVPPVIQEGRTLLPIREIAESYNFEVGWVQDTKTVLIGDSIEMDIDDQVTTVNGSEVELDVPARIIDGRTMVPLRFVVEELGISVGYHNDTGIIYLGD